MASESIASIPVECVTYSDEEFHNRIDQFARDAIKDENGFYMENLVNREILAKQLLCSYYRLHPAGEQHINKTEFFQYITNTLDNTNNALPQENSIIDDGSPLVPALVRSLCVDNFNTMEFSQINEFYTKYLETL